MKLLLYFIVNPLLVGGFDLSCRIEMSVFVRLGLAEDGLKHILLALSSSFGAEGSLTVFTIFRVHRILCC